MYVIQMKKFSKTEKIISTFRDFFFQFINHFDIRGYPFFEGCPAVNALIASVIILVFRFNFYNSILFFLIYSYALTVLE